VHVLIVVNEAPYAGERAFNALRLASALQGQEDVAKVRLFFLSDGVYGGVPNQLRPDGSYNIEHMLAGVIAGGCEVKLCSVCSDQRGMLTMRLGEGIVIGSMKELAEWVAASDRIITF
jgi:uncharacterized protein involved in oxidation of intracellular sulfur